MRPRGATPPRHPLSRADPGTTSRSILLVGRRRRSVNQSLYLTRIFAANEAVFPTGSVASIFSRRTRVRAFGRMRETGEITPVLVWPLRTASVAGQNHPRLDHDLVQRRGRDQNVRREGQ